MERVTLSLRGTSLYLRIKRSGAAADDVITINLEDSKELVFVEPRAVFVQNTTVQAVSVEMVSPDNTTPQAVSVEMVSPPASGSAVSLVKNEPEEEIGSQLTLGDILMAGSDPALDRQMAGNDPPLDGRTEETSTVAPSEFDHEMAPRPDLPEAGDLATYPCEECGKIFKNLRTLKVHARLHTWDKPFRCQTADCSYTSFFPSNLKVHQRKHTGECRCVCEVCGASFGAPSHLRTHERVHTGERPFACDFPGCGYRCSHVSNLTAHRRRHGNAKCFVCHFPSCTFSTHLATVLDKHINDGHNCVKAAVTTDQYHPERTFKPNI